MCNVATSAGVTTGLVATGRKKRACATSLALKGQETTVTEMRCVEGIGQTQSIRYEVSLFLPSIRCEGHQHTNLCSHQSFSLLQTRRPLKSRAVWWNWVLRTGSCRSRLWVTGGERGLTRGE